MSILLVAFESAPRNGMNSAALIAVSEMVKLDSLSMRNANRILDSSEYLLLRSDPALTKVARRFRSERRQLALMWLSLLLGDLRKLARFRAFLVRSGLPSNTKQEIEIFSRLACSLIFINLLKTLVFIFGPFVLHGLIQRAKVPLEGMSRATATLLNELPASQWHDVARGWETSGP